MHEEHVNAAILMLQLQPSPHMMSPPKEPRDSPLWWWQTSVPEPVLRSGLISQTPLLSIRSELVWREMSLCCELQMLSGSVCRSGIEWGSGEGVRAWDGGRMQGGRAYGVGFFSFFKRHCRDRKNRSTGLSVEGWGQLWPVCMRDSCSSDNPWICQSVSGKQSPQSVTDLLIPPSPVCPGKSWSLGSWQMANPEPWPTVRSGFWGTCARYQHHQSLGDSKMLVWAKNQESKLENDQRFTK